MKARTAIMTSAPALRVFECFAEPSRCFAVSGFSGDGTGRVCPTGGIIIEKLLKERSFKSGQPSVDLW